MKIKNVKTLSGEVIDYAIPSLNRLEMDAQSRLLLFPGLIDPHRYAFPKNHQETLLSHSGITSFIEIPLLGRDCSANSQESLDRHPAYSYITEVDFESKLNANVLNTDLIKGVLVDFKSGVDDTLFRLAAQKDIPIVFDLGASMSHSKELKSVIASVEKWSNRLVVLNVSTKEDLECIKKGRDRALLIYAETTPDHLFTADPSSAQHLWDALKNNAIETLGTGYGWTSSNRFVRYKGKTYPLSHPCFFLPLLLEAVSRNKIGLERVAHLTSLNCKEIFEMREAQESILIDLERVENVEIVEGNHVQELTLKGWPYSP